MWNATGLGREGVLRSVAEWGPGRVYQHGVQDLDLEEALLEGGGEVGVRIAEEAGEVVGGGAAAHALVVDHDGLVSAEEDVAGLPIAVDQGLGGIGEEAGDGLKFGGDGGDLPIRDVESGAQDVVDEIGVFPGVERDVESGHEGKARAARGGESLEMQVQGEVEQAAVDRSGGGGRQSRQPRFKGVGAEVLDGEEMVAGGIQKEAGDGEVEGGEEARMAGIEAVVGAIGRPADEDGGIGAEARAEEFTRGAARGEDFDGEGVGGVEELAFAWREHGDGGEGEGVAGVAEASGGVAMGLDILGRGADVGPEGAGDEDAGDAVAGALGAAVGVDEGVKALGGDEGEDARIEELEAAEGGVVGGGGMEVADESVFAVDGFGTGVAGEPAGGEGFLLPPGAKQRGGIEIGDDIGVEEPEGLVEEPVRVAEGAAGAEDDGFEDGGDAQGGEGLGGEVAEDGAGGVMKIDEDVADAPGGKHGEGAVEHGAVPER